MILGLGSDLIDIRRIEKTIDRFGDLLDRIFTETERRRAATGVPTAPAMPAATPPRRRPPRRWARLSPRRVLARSRRVVNLPGGQPTVC